MNKGFTLIEVLIYMAILGLVVSGFVSFSLSISDSRNKNYVIQEVQANGRLALELISQKILSSNGVNIGSSTFDSDPGILSLSMFNGSKNPTLINLNQDDGILQITEGSDNSIYITSDEVKITNLVFTDLTSTSEKASIRIQITIKYDNQGDNVNYEYSQSLQTAVNLRQ